MVPCYCHSKLFSLCWQAALWEKKTMTISLPTLRLRRLRQNPAIRKLVRETKLSLNDLILPLFIKGQEGEKVPIAPMPGHYQIPLNKLEEELDEIRSLGIGSVILFGVPPKKDALGSDSYAENGIVQQAIRIIKETAKDLLVISDICFCEYTDHGHCGIITEDSFGRKDIDNDATLKLLISQAISHAKAGADILAPSGMMDGVVGAMRTGLDSAGFSHLPILSYSVKYNSAMYGPFRAAAEGAPSWGDRSTHMMECSNGKEALREVHLDVEEGADMLMVKPAHSYLDIIYRVKEAYPYIPLGAYHTSGEYCMIKSAAEKGWIDEKKAALEVLEGIKRAGADFIITYFAKDVARW
jgi:porphobilinogen synthase